MMNNQSLYEMQKKHKAQLSSVFFSEERNDREYTLSHLNKMQSIAYAGLLEGNDKSILPGNRLLENSFYYAVTVVARNPHVYGNITPESIKKRELFNPRDGSKWTSDQFSWSANLAINAQNKAKELVETGKVGKIAAGVLCSMFAAGVAMCSPEMRRRTRMEDTIDEIFQKRDKAFKEKSKAPFRNEV